MKIVAFWHLDGDFNTRDIPLISVSII